MRGLSTVFRVEAGATATHRLPREPTWARPFVCAAAWASDRSLEAALFRRLMLTGHAPRRAGAPL